MESRESNLTLLSNKELLQTGGGYWQIAAAGLGIVAIYYIGYNVGRLACK